VAVECLPGPTALIPALVESGFPSDRFVFEGFLPPKKGRQKRLQGLKQEQRTLIFYESPHKLLKTLDQFREVFGPDRQVSVSRELSKLYGETIRGTLDSVAEHFKKNAPKGEFVLVVRGADS
jgi:16S rRNA (cytidine1402-2'-O)-methyltransferase